MNGARELSWPGVAEIVEMFRIEALVDEPSSRRAHWRHATNPLRHPVAISRISLSVSLFLFLCLLELRHFC